jgi:hypothetical protein
LIIKLVGGPFDGRNWIISQEVFNRGQLQVWEPIELKKFNANEDPQPQDLMPRALLYVKEKHKRTDGSTYYKWVYIG